MISNVSMRSFPERPCRALTDEEAEGLARTPPEKPWAPGGGAGVVKARRGGLASAAAGRPGWPGGGFPPAVAAPLGGLSTFPVNLSGAR